MLDLKIIPKTLEVNVKLSDLDYINIHELSLFIKNMKNQIDIKINTESTEGERCLYDIFLDFRSGEFKVLSKEEEKLVSLYLTMFVRTQERGYKFFFNGVLIKEGRQGHSEFHKKLKKVRESVDILLPDGFRFMFTNEIFTPTDMIFDEEDDNFFNNFTTLNIIEEVKDLIGSEDSKNIKWIITEHTEFKTCNVQEKVRRVDSHICFCPPDIISVQRWICENLDPTKHWVATEV